MGIYMLPGEIFLARIHNAYSGKYFKQSDCAGLGITTCIRQFLKARRPGRENRRAFYAPRCGPQ